MKNMGILKEYGEKYEKTKTVKKQMKKYEKI